MKRLGITRRELVRYGMIGLASVGALGSLPACSIGISGSTGASEDQHDGEDGPITATVSYSSVDYNPIGNSTALMLSAGWHVFEGLYDIDMHDFSTYPALAAGEPEAMTPLTYRIELREDARFSDGTPVTSADVVNAFRANLSDEVYNGLIPFLGPDSVKADGDGAVLINLRYELGFPFEELLKSRISLVKIFPASSTEEQLSTLPVGSGPWRYASIDGTDGGRIEFLPNDCYNGDYPAAGESMTWHICLDEAKRARQLEEGTSIVIEDVPPELSNGLVHPGVVVEDIPSFTLALLMFNCNKPPFDDFRVRQALFYGIDADTLIAECLQGKAQPCTGFLPKIYADYHRASTVYSYDPNKARALLHEAGVSGLELELRACDNWVSSLVSRIVEDWSIIGIKATPRIMPPNEVYAGLSPEDAAKGVLPYDVILGVGGQNQFGNDTDLLLSWWYDDREWTEGMTCWQDSKDCARVQQLLSEARREKDPDKQQDKWNECFDIIAEAVPMYPILHRDVSTAYMVDGIEAFSPISTAGLDFLGARPR